MQHFPNRQFLLIGDSGEQDPEVFREIHQRFAPQVQEIMIRDVVARMRGMTIIDVNEALVRRVVSPAKKPLPPSTAQVIFPPNTDHIYFENGQDHPFRFLSQRFEPANAWWLAEAALLAYAEEDFIRSVMQGKALQHLQLVLAFFSSANTQCFVVHNDDFVLVAFRGTEVRTQGAGDFRNIVGDVVTDLTCLAVESGQGGRVHKGFKDALDALWEPRAAPASVQGLKKYLEEVGRPAGQRRPVWFTGHSLGAALATLAADRYGNVQGLYTFGSPRVGDEDFRADFHVNTYRFVNNKDIVTRLPPAPLYQHVGRVKYFDSTGRLHDDPSLWTRLMDGFRSGFGHQFNSLGHLRSGFSNADIPIDHLTDHAPLYYAIHTWNNYVRDLEVDG